MGEDAAKLLRKYEDGYAQSRVMIIQVSHFGLVYRGDKAGFECSLRQGLKVARNAIAEALR